MFSTTYLRLEGKVPPKKWKTWISCQGDILVQTDVPPLPRKWNWTKHECYRKKSFQVRSSSTFYNLSPLIPGPYLILCMHRKLFISIPNGYLKIRISGFQMTVILELDDEIGKKGPLSHWKMKCLFLDYIQFLMISWAIQVMNVDQNAKTGPPCHQKIKCSVLDYVQLLMIGQAIRVMKVDQNAK